MAFRQAMQDYDLGHFENPEGVFLADVASTFTQEEFLDALNGRVTLCTLNGVLDFPDFKQRAEAAASIRRIYCEQAAASAVIESVRIGEHGSDYATVRIAIAAVPRDWKNDAAQRMLEMNPDVDLAVILDVMGGMVSLRSRVGGPDCSRVAGLYGGGGHARAAGFKMIGGTRHALGSLAQEVFG